MEYPIYADTPRGADPLGSWPKYGIVGGEPVLPKEATGGSSFAERARRRKRLRREREREDEDILAVIACMLEADIL